MDEKKKPAEAPEPKKVKPLKSVTSNDVGEQTETKASLKAKGKA